MLPPRVSRRRTAPAVLALAALGACAVGPDFVRPPAPATDRVLNEPTPDDAAAAGGVTQRFSSDTRLPADWWTLFKSPALDAAVGQAIAHSPTLEAALASLRQSQSARRAGDGVFYPQLDASLGATRTHAAAVQESAAATRSVLDVVTLAGTISYTIDVFGGERRTVEGLRAQVDQQRSLVKAAFLALTGNVVDACIARAAYLAQIQATRELVAIERDQLQAILAQERAGTVAHAAVLAQRALIAGNEALLAPLAQKADQAAHLLALLQGTTPADAVAPDLTLAGLTLPVDLPISLPSELVRQRPDILAAEASLHLASANIGVATAALFPVFSLDASFGNASATAGGLFAAGAGFWSLAPTLLAPIFHGGTLRAQRQAAVDAYDVQRADYRQTVLAALSQVADALRALAYDAQALRALDESLRVASLSLKLERTSNGAGLVAEVDVMSADVLYHQAVIADLQAIALRHQDTVALFLALGGGWWNAPAPSAAASAP